MLLSEAFEAYRTGFVVYAQSHKTEEQLIYAKNALVKFTGDIELGDLSIDLVRQWLYHLSQKGLSSSTIKGYGEKLKLVLRYHPGYLDPKLIMLPKRDVKTPDWLTPKQVATIIELVGRPRRGSTVCEKLKLQAIIATLYATGLRVDELCRISILDIDDNTISIVGKGKKSRLVFLDDRALYFISLYLKTRTDHNPALFVTRTGQRVTPARIRSCFRDASRLTGINFHPHTLRHSYATNLLDNNCHIYTLSRLMGHSDISTTSIYLHIKDPELQEAHKRYHSV